MALKDKIFAGANLKIEIADVPVSGGVAADADFKEVPSVASFIGSGFESTVINVTVYNQIFNRVLLGSAEIPQQELVVNWILDNPVHAQLEAYARSQKAMQVKITYYDDGTHTTGVYRTYQAFVASTTVAGDKDEVVTKTFNLAFDGDEIATGEVE